MGMAFDIDRYSRLVARLDTSEIDFDSFAERPLSPTVLRCLRYMHDVEHHTVCYLRDLLVTRAHRDPEVTTFLTLWCYEEHWHGEAIGEVLARHGEQANLARVAQLRRRLRVADQLRPVVSQVASLLSPHVTALHMTWGAVNEWSTQAGYGRLIQLADHPVLTSLLTKIMRQEGRHIDFYMSQARTRLADSRSAQRLVRRALTSLWSPVGSGIMSHEDVAFLVNFLFRGPDGEQAADRIDRRIADLPGLAGLTLVRDAVAQITQAA
jgi:hypothetical protein